MIDALRPRAAAGCSTTSALTLLVALATLVLTVLLYLLIPKGLFPTQDTGQLQARVEAAQDVSYARMAELQQAAARAILEDPEVENLSSFIGVDAANNTMLQHRQHADQPEADARRPGRRDARGCSERVAQGRRRDALPAADAGPDDRRRDRADPVPRLARRRRHGDSDDLGRTARRRDAQRASSCATSAATPARRAWRPSSTSIATPRRASASPPAPSTTRSTARSASASSRRSSPRPTSTA